MAICFLHTGGQGQALGQQTSWVKLHGTGLKGRELGQQTLWVKLHGGTEASLCQCEPKEAAVQSRDKLLDSSLDLLHMSTMTLS